MAPETLQDPTLDLLTRRQSEILALVAKGFTNSEIANLLDLAAGTVKLHVSAIIERLQVTNRTEAAAIWLSGNLTSYIGEQDGAAPGAQMCVIAQGAGDAADADDIANEIADYVSRFLGERGIAVMPPELCRRFADVAGKKELLHDQLGTQYLVRLSVAPGDDTTRVDLELTDLAAGAVLLRDSFAHPLTSLTTLVAEISLDIERALDRQVDPAAKLGDAVEACWQGSYHFSKRTPASLQKAIGLFEKSATLDPVYVPAHVGLANSFHQMAVYAPGMSAYFYGQGLQAAQRAIEIAPQHGPAHAAMGYAQMFGQWNRDAAGRSLERALILDRQQDETLIWHSLWLMFGGAHADALAVAEEGLALNPIAIAHFVHLGHVLRSQGQLDRAIRHLSMALEMEPGNLRATIWMALCQGDAGHHRIGLSHIDRALADYPTAGVLLGVSGYLAGLAGDHDTAEARLAALSAITASPMYSPMFEAFVNIGLGRHDAAIDQLRTSLPQKVPMLLGWYCDPILTRLSGHPDYAAIGDEIGAAQSSQG